MKSCTLSFAKDLNVSLNFANFVALFVRTMGKKYYMYVDECGDQNLSNFEVTFPIFTLCGVIVSESQRIALEEKVNEMKRRFWGTTGVIFHSRDIRKCEKAFVTLFDLEVKQKFYNEINSILGEAGAYTVVTCSILKEEYIRQFGRFNDVYGQSLSLLVERAIFYLDDLNTEGDIDLQIIAEMRGKREDKNLLSYYNQLRDKGTYWITPERLQSHVRRFDFVAKRDNVIGLQIADLIAYPITRHILEPEILNPSFNVLEKNIYCSEGKRLGMKVIPKK